MIIRTKIVATVGPASGSAECLEQLARAGCDVFRVNFSHGDDAQREAFLRNIRAAEQAIGEPLAVMADLCGPKVRVGPIAGGSVLLGEGQQVTIRRGEILGGATEFSTTLDELNDAVAPGEGILLDDGKLRLEALERRNGDELLCVVRRGGVLSSGKGVNLPQTHLALSAMTRKDRRDVDWIAERDFDYVALSFVQRPEDIRELRALLDERNCDARIVAKIEKPQALERLDEIIEATDVVMVARGDLGVEMDLPAVPAAQKRIARAAQAAGKGCIVATQMLETMTHAETPTRAEVSDVANAVLDYTDAVMLSGETAVGEHPVKAVEMMNDIVRAMQTYHDEIAPPMRVEHVSARTVAALAAALREVLEVEEIAAVAVLTATGATARILAKSRLPAPLLAISPRRATVRRLCLYYGVQAVQAEAPEHTRDVLALAERYCRRFDLARPGEKIVVLSGRPLGQPGATNTMVIHTLGGTS